MATIEISLNFSLSLEFVSGCATCTRHVIASPALAQMCPTPVLRLHTKKDWKCALMRSSETVGRYTSGKAKSLTSRGASNSVMEVPLRTDAPRASYVGVRVSFASTNHFGSRGSVVSCSRPLIEGIAPVFTAATPLRVMLALTQPNCIQWQPSQCVPEYVIVNPLSRWASRVP